LVEYALRERVVVMVRTAAVERNLVRADVAVVIVLVYAS
jgi:hypothetical protein